MHLGAVYTFYRDFAAAAAGDFVDGFSFVGIDATNMTYLGCN
jgi:hypothetical protein